MSEFRVTFVCTGNRFRSPLAEALLRQATEGLPVVIDSLGTLDLGAIPPLPEALEEARRLGVDLKHHRSRSLGGASLSEADLVLGFERIHVATAVVDAGADRDRTFTLPELVGLLERIAPSEGEEEDAAACARTAVAAAARLRPGDPLRIGKPELADPLGGGADVARRTADEIRALTNRLIGRLFKG